MKGPKRGGGGLGIIRDEEGMMKGEGIILTQ